MSDPTPPIIRLVPVADPAVRTPPTVAGSAADRLAHAEAVAGVAAALVSNPIVWHALHAAAAAGRGDAGLAAATARGAPLARAQARRVDELVQDLAELVRDPAGCGEALLSLEALDATVRAWRARTERAGVVPTVATVTPPDPTHTVGGRA